MMRSIPAVAFVFLSFVILSFAGVPEQVHLSVTGDPSEMVVTWVSSKPAASFDHINEKEPDCAALPPKDEWIIHPSQHHKNLHPILSREAFTAPEVTEGDSAAVMFGVSASSLSSLQNASVFTYGVPPDWSWTLHTAVLTGLTPDTTYYYKVGSDDEFGWSTVYTLRTPPATDRPTNIVFMGDMGTSLSGTGPITATRLAKDMQSNDFDLVVIAGDIAYPYVFEPLWDVWFNFIQPIASEIPWMVCPGNQDADFSFAGYLNRFRMPGLESGSNTTFYFSYNYGLVHFIAMSTEHNYHPGSAQYLWLEQDLIKANANRDKQPWIIIYGHRPMYCSNLVWCPDTAPLRDSVEPLLAQYKVDLALWGHVHMYERSYPMLNGTSVQQNYDNPAAPVHVCSGTAGALLCAYLTKDVPEWSAVRTLQFGYSKFQVYNSTHLHYEFVEQINGEVWDEFWIVQNKH